MGDVRTAKAEELAGEANQGASQDGTGRKYVSLRPVARAQLQQQQLLAQAASKGGNGLVVEATPTEISNERHPQISFWEKTKMGLGLLSEREKRDYIEKKLGLKTEMKDGRMLVWKDGDPKKYQFSSGAFDLSNVAEAIGPGVMIAVQTVALGVKAIGGATGIGLAPAMGIGAALGGGTNIVMQGLGMALGVRDSFDFGSLAKDTLAGAIFPGAGKAVGALASAGFRAVGKEAVLATAVGKAPAALIAAGDLFAGGAVANTSSQTIDRASGERDSVSLTNAASAGVFAAIVGPHTAKYLSTKVANVYNRFRKGGTTQSASASGTTASGGTNATPDPNTSSASNSNAGPGTTSAPGASNAAGATSAPKVELADMKLTQRVGLVNKPKKGEGAAGDEREPIFEHVYRKGEKIYTSTITAVAIDDGKAAKFVVRTMVSTSKGGRIPAPPKKEFATAKEALADVGLNGEKAPNLLDDLQKLRDNVVKQEQGTSSGGNGKSKLDPKANGGSSSTSGGASSQSGSDPQSQASSAGPSAGPSTGGAQQSTGSGQTSGPRSSPANAKDPFKARPSAAPGQAPKTGPAATPATESPTFIAAKTRFEKHHQGWKNANEEYQQFAAKGDDEKQQLLTSLRDEVTNATSPKAKAEAERKLKLFENGPGKEPIAPVKDTDRATAEVNELEQKLKGAAGSPERGAFERLASVEPEAIRIQGGPRMKPDQYRDAAAQIQQMRDQGQVVPDYVLQRFKIVEENARKDKELKDSVLKLLGLPKDADYSAAKSAYRQLFKRYHSDTTAKEPDGLALMDLSSPIRKRYDQLIEQQAKIAQSVGSIKAAVDHLKEYGFLN